jgi:hypothetical protein
MSVVKEVKVATGSAKDETKREAMFNYSMPESLTEAIATIGEPGVLKEFLAGFAISIQAPARKYLQSMDATSSQEDRNLGVQEHMDAWKYGEKAPRSPRTPKDPLVAFAEMWKGYDDAKKAEIIAKYGLVVPTHPEETQAEENSTRATRGHRVH